MARITLGVRIAEHLAAHGVGHVFGIPGVHNIELYRGIAQAGITHVLTRHEQGAGFMADGHARMTGRPGVAFVITGPGLANILTPLGQAWSDSVPVLAISSCLEGADDGMGRGRLHEMRNQELAAECVCAWSRTARAARSAFELIDRAFAGFASGRPRPCHIQVPIDLLAAEAPAGPPPAPAPLRPRAPDAALAPIAEALVAARRPVLIFGGGARGAAAGAVSGLARACGAAVFSTYAGRGVLGPGWPLDLGSTLPTAAAPEMLARADFVCAIGTELAEGDLWREELGARCPLARIDIDPAVLSDRHGAALTALGDAPDAIARLAGMVAARGAQAARSDWDPAEVADYRARARAAVEAEWPGVLAAVETVLAGLPEDATIFSDMTQFAYSGMTLDLPAGMAWHHPHGFGTLGWALPAAIGAKVGAPAAPVVAVAGDYGFHYTMQELGTAVELGLNLPILIWDNAMLKEIEASMARAQIAPVAVKAHNPDFLALARAFGAEAAEPANAAEVGPAIAAAFGRDRPTLIRLTPQAMAR